MKQKISACIVIHNEEKLLPRCLESLKSVVDGIIVVHDGPCKDQSLEIAKKYKAKVFVQPFVGEAEAHRPFSYSQATGNWILQIDADEFLSESARKNLQKLILDDTVDAYRLSWPANDGKEYLKGVYSKMTKPCLFRKSQMYMIGISHSSAQTYGVMKERTDLQLSHEPLYNNFTWKNFKSKWIKWAKIESSQVLNLEKGSFYNVLAEKKNPTLDYYNFSRRFPLLSAFKEILSTLHFAVRNGLLISDWISWKITTMVTLRILLTHFYMWKFKNNI